jgi:hypothetical protein
MFSMSFSLINIDLLELIVVSYGTKKSTIRLVCSCKRLYEKFHKFINNNFINLQKDFKISYSLEYKFYCRDRFSNTHVFDRRVDILPTDSNESHALRQDCCYLLGDNKIEFYYNDFILKVIECSIHESSYLKALLYKDFQ